MCTKCFKSEYYKFDDEKVNSEIENKITKLHSEKSLTLLSKVTSNKFVYQNYIIYYCNFCDQIWCYSIADLYWRGFLVKKENLQNLISKYKKSDSRTKIGCIILLFIIISVLILCLSSCTSTKNIQGKYKSNFADLGFFINTIKFKNDSTFKYNYSGDLVNQDLTGTYKIHKNKLYLKFIKNKGEIEYQNDSLSISEILSENRHNYKLKNENGINYHRKFLIKNGKLFNYREDNGKLVKRAKKYSGKKRYIIFGPTSNFKKFYLKKVE